MLHTLAGKMLTFLMRGVCAECGQLIVNVMHFYTFVGG